VTSPEYRVGHPTFAVRYTNMRIVILLTATLLSAVGTSYSAPAKSASKKGAVHHPAARHSSTPKPAGIAQAQANAKARNRAANQSHPRSNAGKASAAKGRKGVRRTTWRNRQLAPTPERYKEIQTALAAKGYLSAEDATGQWNQKSIDALKRFQDEQKIAATGKLNSLSLIALGLGPKHDNQAALRLGSVQQAAN